VLFGFGRVHCGTPTTVLKRSTRVQGSHVNGTIHSRGAAFFFSFFFSLTTLPQLAAVDSSRRSLLRFHHILLHVSSNG